MAVFLRLLDRLGTLHPSTAQVCVWVALGYGIPSLILIFREAAARFVPARLIAVLPYVLAGVSVGLIYSCVLLWSGPWFDTESLDTVDAATFEHALLGQVIRKGEPPLVEHFHKGLPVVRDLVVHPPIVSSLTPTRSWVTGELYSCRPQPKDPKVPNGKMVAAEQWRPFKYPADTPYLAYNGAGGVITDAKHGTPYPTVIAYLDALRQKDKTANFTFRFAWPETKAAIWILPPIAGLLIIGIAWPTGVGAMRAIGMAPPPKAAAKPKPAFKPVVRPTPAVSGVRVAVAPPPPPLPVGDSKHYGGEFYPVVKND